MLAPSVCLRGELSLGAKPGDGAQPEGKAGRWGSAWGQSREMGLSLGARSETGLRLGAKLGDAAQPGSKAWGTRLSLGAP